MVTGASVQGSYRRPDIDGGVLTDKQEIAYYKRVQANDVVFNELLGDYNDAGNYVIKKSIVEELLNVTKIVQHTYGKTIYCTSKMIVKNRYLEFALKILPNNPEKGQATATLEFLEAIDKIEGYVQNINTALIGTYVDAYNAEFLLKAYKAFNIIQKTDIGKSKEKKDETLTEIFERKNFLEALKKLLSLKLVETEKFLYERRIALLKEAGIDGKDILNELKKEILRTSKFMHNKDGLDYFKSMNQLLDKVLDSKGRNTLSQDMVNRLKDLEMQYVIDSKKVFELAIEEQLKSQTQPKLVEMTTKQINDQKMAKAPESKTPVVNIEKTIKLDAELIGKVNKAPESAQYYETEKGVKFTPAMPQNTEEQETQQPESVARQTILVDEKENTTRSESEVLKNEGPINEGQVKEAPEVSAKSILDDLEHFK
ncbi:MAG: hypothetical protein AB7S44_01000 [Spirochaetales bacterium]